MFVWQAVAGNGILILRLKRDGTEIFSRRYELNVAAANSFTLVPGFVACDSGAAAGTRTYGITVLLTGPTGASVKTPTDTFPGFIQAVAFA